MGPFFGLQYVLLGHGFNSFLVLQNSLNCLGRSGLFISDRSCSILLKILIRVDVNSVQLVKELNQKAITYKRRKIQVCVSSLPRCHSSYFSYACEVSSYCWVNTSFLFNLFSYACEGSTTVCIYFNSDETRKQIASINCIIKHAIP